jgi:hypothetical protein
MGESILLNKDESVDLCLLSDGIGGESGDFLSPGTSLSNSPNGLINLFRGFRSPQLRYRTSYPGQPTDDQGPAYAKVSFR